MSSSCLGRACTVQHRNPDCRGGKNKEVKALQDEIAELKTARDTYMKSLRQCVGERDQAVKNAEASKRRELAMRDKYAKHMDGKTRQENLALKSERSSLLGELATIFGPTKPHHGMTMNAAILANIGTHLSEMESERYKALRAYHALARATGHCGPNLSDRCWACAELDRDL